MRSNYRRHFFLDLQSIDLALTSHHMKACDSDSDSQGYANWSQNFKKNLQLKRRISPVHPKLLKGEQLETNGHADLKVDMKTPVEFENLISPISTPEPDVASESLSILPNVTAMDEMLFSDSNCKTQTPSIDGGIEGRRADVATKKHGTSRGGKHLEASEVDESNSSKIRRKEKKLKEENPKSNKKIKNPTVFLLKE